MKTSMKLSRFLLVLILISSSFHLSYSQQAQPAEDPKPVAAAAAADEEEPKPIARAGAAAGGARAGAAADDEEIKAKPAAALAGDDEAAEEEEAPPPPPPGQDACNGVFLTYNFLEREKEYPLVRNRTAQAWMFKALATITNTGKDEIQGWKFYIGFQHREILVSATGGSLLDAGDFPAAVGNGTTFVGSPNTNLKTAIETANDIEQISTKIEMKGTVFGGGANTRPMPKTIKLMNDGFKCPKATAKGGSMRVCCKKDPKYKVPKLKTKFARRQKGDLVITYDAIQAYGNNYLAQVTMENQNALSQVNHWNLTWEWQYNEFIYSMRGAYPRKKDYSECIFGAAGKALKDFDFAKVLNCEKKPIISDLPKDRENDTEIGRVPFCCRNGSLLSPKIDKSKSKSVFQMNVYKLPPNDNRTAIIPPRKWNVKGTLNPTYTCGPPIRVDPSLFPDPAGLQATVSAIASWQIVCNVAPKGRDKTAGCCVSFSAYYNESIIPCRTCACGCPQTRRCNPRARAMLIPSEAQLVPFANRTVKARAWASLKHFRVPNPLPCPDNCGVSINWHINSDFTDGWSARMTVFNWGSDSYEDWFTAIKIDKAYTDYENVYSFNGSRIREPKVIFFHGLEGGNFLNGMTNGTNPNKDPKVPGKLQSVISFKKRHNHRINIQRGEGFPTKIFFNGEQCVLPTEFPRGEGTRNISPVNFFVAMFVAVMTFVMTQDSLMR